MSRRVLVFAALAAAGVAGILYLATQAQHGAWKLVEASHKADQKARVEALKVQLDGSAPREGSAQQFHDIGVTLRSLDRTMASINGRLDAQREVSGSLACDPAGGDVADGHCVFFDGDKPVLVPLDEPKTILNRRRARPRAMRAVRAAKESTP